MPGAVIDSEALFAPLLGRRGIGLAVSGGPDSLALLLLFADWQQRHSDAPPAFVYSVDHRLRVEAAAEVAMVLGVSARLGIPARGLAWIEPKPASGLMAAARSARYRLISAAMAADNADVLLTAHHLDDQAETVLMRLAHGSGIEGLSGMAPFAEVEGLSVYRPLLGVPRSVLADIVTSAGLTPVDDPSNRDLDYERVRWRAIIPALAELGLDAYRLGRFAQRLLEVDDWIEAECRRALAGIVIGSVGESCEFDRATLVSLPPPVAVRCLSRLLARVGGERKPHALGAVERLFQRLRDHPEFRRETLQGCLVAARQGRIRISPETGRRRGLRPLTGAT